MTIECTSFDRISTFVTPRLRHLKRALIFTSGNAPEDAG
jgi:hypothetical protein